ncbi:ribosome small subunit-dependent GTPase A [Halovulum sp. GXIMD14794]
MIRPYDPKDADAVVAVWHAAASAAHDFLPAGFHDENAETIRTVYLPAAETWVAEHEGRVAGFVSLLDTEVGGLFVAPDCQGLGLGRALLDHAVAERGALSLTVFARNPSARAFYAAYGFTVTGEGTDEATGEPVLHLGYTPADLAALGWRPHFTAQLDMDEFGTLAPVRVLTVDRSGLTVQGETLSAHVPPLPEDRGGPATVGDWLLVEPETLRPVRLLDRFSLIARRAPGAGRERQLIAANLDTLFITTSCNQDFNPARLERYLALAREAEVTPVVVLTKADLCDDPQALARQAEALLPGLMVEVLDARDPQAAGRLSPWCGKGQTVGIVGSSGVGKSTLIGTLTGQTLATQGIREDDAKGRHTTTRRQLHRLPGGGWLLDTPGMRELQLADAAEGLAEVFADITELAATCRFNDCHHQTEPGCAVQAAIEDGTLDPARLARWRKLAAEDAHNSASLAERRARDKEFGKMVKRITKGKPNRR